MKEKKYSPYATNQGGKISRERPAPVGEPKSTKREGSDLRTKKG